MIIEIYHNPRCSKSRQTLQLLRAQGIEPTVIEYLKVPPSNSRLKAILTMLSMEPRQLMRKGEAEYKEQNLADESLSAEHLIDAMLATPKLIERPIVINGDRATIGRPPENVLDLI